MPALPAKEYASILEGLNIYYVAGPDDFDLIVPAISELLAGESEYIGVDTETTGLHPRTDYVRLLQLSNGYSSLVIDLDAFRESEGGPIDWKHPQLKFVKRFLQKTEKTLTIHNAAFDVNFLVEAGIRFTRQKFFDTLIASRIINNGTGASNALDAVVKRRLGITISKEMQKSNFRLELSLDQIRYAAVDAAILCHLAPVLDELLYQNALSADRNLHNVFEIEMKALLPIVLMEHKGFGFDLPLARSQRILMVEEAERAKLAFCEALDARLAKKKGAPRLPRDPDGSLNLRAKTTGSVRLGTKKLAGYNPRSGPQTTHFMTAAGIRLRPNAKGKISLDQNLLSFLRHTNDLIDMYMVWKEKATLISHMDKLIKSTEKDGRIHAKYNQMGTKTGRLSSSDPNLQQVPKSKTFRSLLKASERKVLVKADYSQVELRVAAFFSREPVMLQAYMEGRDLHIETACRMTGKNPEDITQEERKSAKICNFGLIYGAGPATLQRQAMAQYDTYWPIEEAREKVQAFREGYPVLFAWQRQEGEATTASIYTISGRRRIVQGTRDDKFTVRVNTKVQGTAGDIAKVAMGFLWDKLVEAPEGQADLISMVHDEIVMEVDEDAAEQWAQTLKDCMENAGRVYITDVPIVADVGIGRNWAEVS